MTVSELEDLFEEIKQAPCGDSWIEVFGKEYTTDVAYAFDGMEIFLDAVRRRFGNEHDMEKEKVMKGVVLLQPSKIYEPETYEKMKDILKKNEGKEEKKEKDNFLEEDDEED